MVLVYECPVIICGCDKLNTEHPSVVGGSAFGQCFSLSGDYRLTHVFLHLDRLNNPDAVICARLYRSKLDGSERYIPDDTPIDSGILAQSVSRQASEVIPTGVGAQWFRFNFTGDQRYIMRSGVTYIIQIVAITVTLMDATNYVRVWGPTGVETCVCDESGHKDGVWQSWDWAICLRVHADLYVEPEPEEPEPEPKSGFDAPVENVYGGGGEGTLTKEHVEDESDTHLIPPMVG